MIEFLCLGSGSSGNCYFLKTENSSILIDAGLGIRVTKRMLKDYGYALEAVDAVFITHDHADHIKAVGHLANDLGKAIYTTAEVHKGISTNYITKKEVPALRKAFVKKNEPCQLGDFCITPFEVSHDSNDCVGYKVVVDEITFCLITDCGTVTPEIEKAINEANYLVLEANHEETMLATGPYPEHLKKRIRSQRGHLSNRECANALAQNATEHLKHVWLCHLSEENNHPELARKTIDQVLRSFGIIAGVDFQMEVLKRNAPSGVYKLT